MDKKVRYKFIEAMLDVHGQVKRENLTRRFGISYSQASRVFSQYSQLAPQNLSLNGKAYVKTQSYTARFLTTNAQTFLDALELVFE